MTAARRSAAPWRHDRCCGSVPSIILGTLADRRTSPDFHALASSSILRVRRLPSLWECGEHHGSRHLSRQCWRMRSTIAPVRVSLRREGRGMSICSFRLTGDKRAGGQVARFEQVLGLYQEIRAGREAYVGAGSTWSANKCENPSLSHPRVLTE